jgi:uncharacterized protein YihD (DUF1040 family)
MKSTDFADFGYWPKKPVSFVLQKIKKMHPKVHFLMKEKDLTIEIMIYHLS